jgi:hypothetical protein
MSRVRSITSRAVFAALCVLVVFSVGVMNAQSDVDARKIMEGVQSQNTSHDLTMKADFEIFDKQGKDAKREFTLMRLQAGGESKTLVAFTSPAEIRGVVLLSVNEKAQPAREYVYTPATQRVRSVVQQERSSRFIGTDFTFEDIGERSLDDFNYKLIGNGELIDGHKTYKIEADPVTADRSQYKYIYYWVAQDVPVILFAELYDANGSKVRVMHATTLKRENGIWGARHTEMRTIADGTRTVLTINAVKFNTRPNEKLFTPEGMSGVLSAGK